MPQVTEAVRIHLNKLRQGLVTCVHCGVQRTVNMAQYPEYHSGNKSLQVKCNLCKKPFLVRFDLRRYHRVTTHFPGQLVQQQTGSALPPITIASLSVSGVGFHMPIPPDMKLGEKYHITFTLDDEDRSTVSETVIVKCIYGTLIGAEFDPPDRYHHALDFYVLANTPLGDF